ncbi:hypothetical protein [Neorhizobium alkalisoli]|uniref:hypothetical protein n=1 Tax=Neorhizobium alkalisoli TaxID=528178 RepID=UPI001319C0A2|nr:hypothetical protein [Neorhizobium alkalisoli]
MPMKIEMTTREAKFLFLPLSAFAVTAVSWLVGVYSLYWFISLVVLWVGFRFFIRNCVAITDRNENGEGPGPG